MCRQSNPGVTRERALAEMRAHYWRDTLGVVSSTGVQAGAPCQVLVVLTSLDEGSPMAHSATAAGPRNCGAEYAQQGLQAYSPCVAANELRVV